VVAGFEVLDFDMPAAEATETPARSAKAATVRRLAFLILLDVSRPYRKMFATDGMFRFARAALN
jgi:hypothetical protein